MTTGTTKEPGPAVLIKKFCSIPENPVRIAEMKELMDACKQGDAAAGLPVGTTLAELAKGIPEEASSGCN